MVHGGVLSAALAVFVMMAAPDLRAESLTEIKTKALEEGALNLAGFSRDDCSFANVIDNFSKKYPEIVVTELMPDATSEQQLATLRQAGANAGPDLPDVVHLDYIFGPPAKAEGLLQPYIANNLNELPLPAFDVEYGDRYWSGAYFYVAAMLVNLDVVASPPKNWADLLKPEYAGQIAFPVDPATSPVVAMAVLSAGRALAGPEDNAPAVGLAHFAAIAAAGNMAPVAGTPETVAAGTTPILILSDAEAIKGRDRLAEKARLEVIIPMRGATADIHLLAIAASAPHPNAAKLWFEHFYTAVNQTELLRGDCHPILWSDYADWDMLEPKLTEGKPSNLIYTVAHFPSFEDRAESTELVASQWDAVVGKP
jgi:putative spermidine/putrescine transport system substrate-binding protein